MLSQGVLVVTGNPVQYFFPAKNRRLLAGCKKWRRLGDSVWFLKVGLCYIARVSVNIGKAILLVK